MNKLDLLEDKIKSAGKIVQQLRDKNGRLQEQLNKTLEENELLQSENQQVRKIFGELEKLREERKLVKQKCEKLLFQYKKISL